MRHRLKIGPKQSEQISSDQTVDCRAPDSLMIGQWDTDFRPYPKLSYCHFSKTTEPSLLRYAKLHSQHSLSC